MKNLLPLLALAALLAACQSAPRDLGEQLGRDNPRLITYLSTLNEKNLNKPVSGIRLYDGVELKGATLLGFTHLPARRQHIYLFRTPDGLRAYVWVDTGGQPLPVPPDHSDSPGEGAYVLSGDIYTHTHVHPGDGIVILSGATPAWFKNQR